MLGADIRFTPLFFDISSRVSVISLSPAFFNFSRGSATLALYSILCRGGMMLRNPLSL